MVVMEYFLIALELNIFQKKLKKNLGNKNIINIYRIQYFCIGFIDFILKSKSLLYYTNLFSPNEYAQNDKSILKHFQ